MSNHRPRFWRAALLLGSAALIGKLFLAGEMVKYMTPALDPLTALTGLVLAAMGVMELVGGADRDRREGGDEPAHAEGLEAALTYALVLLPLALGLVVTPRALGFGALGGESVAGLLLTFAPGTAGASGGPPAPARPLTDVPAVLGYLRQAGESGVGQRVRVTGLVAPSDGLAGNEFALLRYAIAHCVADARPLGLLVVAPGDHGLPADRWVEVEGVLAVREREGDRLVSIVAGRITPIDEPADPYVPAVF